ncbi:MAG TPA: ThuA domain-containing protein [Puia sp.]|nr:ThuA domain-containing protein [Puia sp.]
MRPILQRLLPFLFILVTAMVGRSQLPMKRGIIQYDKRYILKQVIPDGEKLRWMRLAASQPIPGFPDSKLTVTVEDKEAGSMSGTAQCKVVTGDRGDFYYLRWDWAMKTYDSGYFLTMNHYYEKPTEKGISNEFSKIEYRWWDFRRGHPWRPGDGRLFAGLDSATSSLAGSVYALEEQGAAAVGSSGGAGSAGRSGVAGSGREFKRAGQSKVRFRVLALYENGGYHLAYSKRAKVWLDQLAADSSFKIDYITRPDTITEGVLSAYQLIIQLDYAPYAWKLEAMAAFTKYIEEGRGGWIGMHHATLLGEFDGYPMWPWFSQFMGGIRWKDYIARFASGVVHVESKDHPVMEDVPDSFLIEKEEWYTWDKSPRPNVQVLAHVDESSYRPDTTVKMGDHPVIWSNPKMGARNVYIFMGHDPTLFDNDAYKKILTNAIFWAAATRAGQGTRAVQGEKPGVKPAQGPAKFKALALYSTNVEPDHVDFARDAIRYYAALAADKGFVFDTTTNWDKLNRENLQNYKVVLWLNEFPKNDAQRAAFEDYMQHGGAWLGFHVAGYNDRYTKWRWFVDMLGGAVFYNNNWPPLPAKLIVNDQKHPVTRHLPARYTAPINEWYGWNPNPRQNKDVRVLMTLDTSNYPLGKKDVIREGDIPVVWTNTRYRMLYINMGHGDQIFVSPVQNRLFEDAILWLGEGEKKLGEGGMK